MPWRHLGSVTLSPTTEEAVIGQVTVPPTNGLEVMIRQITPPGPYRFAYGILSYRSVLGKEIGSVKAWASKDWEAVRLGAGLQCQARSGALLFAPRSCNLRWIRAGFAWGLEFMVDEHYPLPADRHEAPGFVDPADHPLRLVEVGTLGRLHF